MAQLVETNITRTTTNITYNQDGSYESDYEETEETFYNYELYKRPPQYKITVSARCETVRKRLTGNEALVLEVKTNNVPDGPFYSTDLNAWGRYEAGNRIDAANLSKEVSEALVDSKMVEELFMNVFDAVYDSDFIILQDKNLYYGFYELCRKLLEARK